jgi:hypothetical protein
MFLSIWCLAPVLTFLLWILVSRLVRFIHVIVRGARMP